MSQLKHLYCTRCVKLRKLPRKLPLIYSKFKDIIIDLEGCTSIFAVDGSAASGKGASTRRRAAVVGGLDKDGGSQNSPFLEVEQQSIIRQLLKCAEETACSDLLTVRDGLGLRLEATGCRLRD